MTSHITGVGGASNTMPSSTGSSCPSSFTRHSACAPASCAIPASSPLAWQIDAPPFMHTYRWPWHSRAQCGPPIGPRPSASARGHLIETSTFIVLTSIRHTWLRYCSVTHALPGALAHARPWRPTNGSPLPSAADGGSNVAVSNCAFSTPSGPTSQRSSRPSSICEMRTTPTPVPPAAPDGSCG